MSGRVDEGIWRPLRHKPCDRAYVPECPTSRFFLNAVQMAAMACVTASAPERVIIAAEYCRKRGARIGYEVTETETSYHDRGATRYQLEWDERNGLSGKAWVSVCALRVTGASDADAVCLRLAGFVPDGDGAWLWREMP